MSQMPASDGSSSRVSANSANTTHGSATDTSAYYDHNLLTINLQLLPPHAQQITLTKNHQINNIYQCDSCNFNFINVIDAIPTDGMNPLWQEVQISFIGGATPHQLFSDNEILAAEAAGQITVTPTGEMYTCSVIGSK